MQVLRCAGVGAKLSGAGAKVSGASPRISGTGVVDYWMYHDIELISLDRYPAC